MQSFEQLDVWQNSRLLTIKIYAITRKFPSDERFGLTNQIRRAAVSVSSNIAEGAGRLSSKEQKHFYSMAFGSLSEVLSQLIIAHDLNFLDSESLKSLRAEIDYIGRQLSKLSAALNHKL